MTYPGYIDLATGKTLVCEPGGTYDLLPDSVPTDGRFTAVISKKEEVQEDLDDECADVILPAQKTVPPEDKDL